MSVRFSRSRVAVLLAEAAASPHAETCGLLLDGADGAVRAEPARNVAAYPSRSFEIDPASLLTAHRASRAGGPGVIGCYHSHPSGDATPSARDAAAAQPGLLWLILGGGEARLWRAGVEGFVEETIDWC